MKRQPNIFDKIGKAIPGYKGYQERDGRRECDRRLREQIADKLSEIEKKVTDLIDYANMAELAEIEKNRKKINNLKDLIKYSPYGASAFFSDYIIKDDELEEIYQMDLAILNTVQKLESDIEIKQLVNLKESIQETEESIKKRNHYLKDK